MEIYRLPPFPLTLDYSGLSPTQNYVATLATMHNDFDSEYEATSNGNGDVSFTLGERFSRYDGEYSVIVYEGTADAKGDVVVLDTARFVRPYVNPFDIAPAGEEDNYKKYERQARIMIDNIVGGFYYQNLVVETKGSGTDILPLGYRVNKVLEVVENNTLLYEVDGLENVATYVLTDNKQSLKVFSDETKNYDEGTAPYPAPAHSDSYDNPLKRYVDFPYRYDYRISVESGWPAVPQDIKEATALIIDDMACGGPNYWSKYVREYETKDYRVDFHRTMFHGTGNLIVDQILQRYVGQTLYNNIRVL